MLSINNQTNKIFVPSKIGMTDKACPDSSLSPKISDRIIFTSNPISFKGFSPKYYGAKQYLDRYKEVMDFIPKKNTDLYDFSLNKLDGIQEGIKVFDGLNMKEIAFLARTMTEFAVNRGCHNMCSHCYADAKPPLKETNEQINKMSWNDFKSLTDGFSELNNRLGFYASGPEVNVRRRAYISPFHDADGLDVLLKDNSGKEHDFTDVTEELHKSMGLPLVFDTAGWTPFDKKIQARAEKIVKYFSDKENMDKLLQFNISINPFHALHTRQIMLERIGETQKADKFKELYENRIANAIFTFTPVLDSEKTGFIQRVASSDMETFDGFRESDLYVMKKGIMNKVRALYEADLEGEQKFIKNRTDVELKMFDVARLMLKPVSSGFTLADRGQKVFGTYNRHATETEAKVFHAKRIVRDAKNVKDILTESFNGILDSNGKYYLTSWSATFPTEIKLNFENTDKLTAPIRPLLQEDLTIKRTLINNI